jgi:hypothetical protein
MNSPGPSATSLRQQIAGGALRILENTQQTRYEHDIYINEATGTYDVDCSGFVSYILGRVAPNHLSFIPMHSGETRLLAQDYYSFFSSLSNEMVNGWRQILCLRDARPGDLIAWALPPPNPDTGHVFVVAAEPVALNPNTMAVKAYDASDILHYDDSRGPGREFQTGVGSGTFHLQIDANGKQVAFQFGPGDPVVPNQIAIGRGELFET